MKIEIEMDEAEFKQKLIEAFAEKLYDDGFPKNIKWFRTKQEISKVVREEAIKYLESSGKIKEKIKSMLSDDNFLKEAVSRTVEEESEKILSELKS